MPLDASAIFAPGLLAGKVALVTGGGTGLGRAAAVELAACGAQVVISGRREDVLVDALEHIGHCASHVAGDVREPADAARMVDAALERHGRLDVLVNTAGGQYFAPAESIAVKGWRAVTRHNVGGTELMTRTAVERAMRPAGRGTIVSVTLSPHHGLSAMTHSSAASDLGRSLTGSVLTVDGARDNWFGPWPPGEIAGRDGEVPIGGAPPGSELGCASCERAWCKGCTRAFQALGTGSNPVARSFRPPPSGSGGRRVRDALRMLPGVLEKQPLARPWRASRCRGAEPVESDRRREVHSPRSRGVAQSGSAPGWGPGGRRFKSCLPD